MGGQNPVTQAYMASQNQPQAAAPQAAPQAASTPSAPASAPTMQPPTFAGPTGMPTFAPQFGLNSFAPFAQFWGNHGPPQMPGPALPPHPGQGVPNGVMPMQQPNMQPTIMTPFAAPAQPQAPGQPQAPMFGYRSY